MSIKNLDFSKIDYSIIEEDLKMIEKEVLALRKNKRYMKKLRRYQDEKNTTATFNNLDIFNKKKSSFSSVSNNTLKSVKSSGETLYEIGKFSSCG